MSCKRTARRPPRTVRLGIDSLAFGGDAVGRDEGGRVTFVPGAAPGDEVIATLVEEHKGWARADLGRVVTPSPARVRPVCALVDAEPGCGGCSWQHVTLAAQHEAKADIVRRALRKLPAEVRPLATPAPGLGWRRRARLRARGGKLGFQARRSHQLVDVPACPQLEPALDAALARVRAGLLPQLTAAADVHLLVSARGEVHAAIEGAGVATLEAAVAALGFAGVVLREPGGAERVVGQAEIDLADDPAGPFWARADGFVQASAAGNTALRELVRAAVAAAGLGAGARILELHAGAGNFTRDLARAGATIVAVEEVAPAVALARRNVVAAERVTWRAEPAAAALRALAGERFDLVLVDPPRTGLGPGEAAALRALGAPRLIYVSCDPETLARDLGTLAPSAVTVTPLDLMPQTFHIECVAVATLPGR